MVAPVGIGVGNGLSAGVRAAGVNGVGATDGDWTVGD